MTLDELIIELQEIKNLHTLAGRCEIIRLTKKQKFPEFLQSVSYRPYPGTTSINVIKLEFE